MTVSVDASRARVTPQLFASVASRKPVDSFHEVLPVFFIVIVTVKDCPATTEVGTVWETKTAFSAGVLRKLSTSTCRRGRKVLTSASESLKRRLSAGSSSSLTCVKNCEDGKVR